MAKKVKNDETMVDVEVEEVKQPKKRKTSTTTKRKTAKAKTPSPIAQEIDAEIDGNTEKLPNKLITKDGKVNTALIDPKKRKYYDAIAKTLNERDITSIANYGSDLSRAMDAYSNDFLNQSLDSKSGIESAELISNLLGELQEVNLEDLEAPTAIKRILAKIPGLRKFVVSVEQIKAKYNTIQKNIDGIVKKLQVARQIALRDNNLLENQFQNNCDYIDQLRDLIVAGKLKSEELDGMINEMKVHADEYEDYQISDMEAYKNSLDKRITDLVMMHFTFQQTLSQIRIIQRTSIISADNVETQVTQTIPLWKNQMSLAVALFNQKKTMEITSKVADATNKLLTKNSEMMKTQAIEITKQSQRSVIDIETLRKTTQDLLATVEGVQKEQKEGAEKRAAAEAELRKLEAQMTKTTIGIAESTKHIIAKELKGKEDLLLEE